MKKKPKLNGLALANWVNDWVSKFKPHWQVTEVRILREAALINFRRDLYGYLSGFAFSHSWFRKGLKLELEIKGDVLGAKYSKGLLEMIEKHYPEEFNGVPSLPDIRGENVGIRPEVKSLTKQGFYQWYRVWEASVKDQFAPKVTEDNLRAFNIAFGVALHTWLSTLYVNRDLLPLDYGVNLVDGKLVFNQHVDNLLECPIGFRKDNVECVDLVHISHLLGVARMQVMMRCTADNDDTYIVKSTKVIGERVNRDIIAYLRECCVDPVWLTKSYAFTLDVKGYLSLTQDTKDLYAAPHPRTKEKTTVSTSLLPSVEPSVY